MTDEGRPQELHSNYVFNRTTNGFKISAGVGAFTGVMIGAVTVAALPAVISGAAIGAVGTGIAYVVANNEKIDALEKDGLQKSLDSKNEMLRVVKKEMDQFQAEKKNQEHKKQELLIRIRRTEEEMEELRISFETQMYELKNKHIMVMIGKTGHGKSTLGNRICGDISITGNEGPFSVSAKKYKAGTTEVISAAADEEYQIDDNDPNKEVLDAITILLSCLFAIYLVYTFDATLFIWKGSLAFMWMLLFIYLISCLFGSSTKAQYMYIALLSFESVGYCFTSAAFLLDLFRSNNYIEQNKQDKQDEESSLLIVDTPGWGDVDETNRDDHKNLVVGYLKGCGGINSFVMVISKMDRIDASIQQMLSEYEKLFGNEFWKHLIIIMTGIDDEDALKEFKRETHVVDIQKLLKKKFEHFASLNCDVSVIPIGNKIYKKQIPLIIKKMSAEKFTCDALKGPYELLQKKHEGQKKELASVDREVAKIEENISSKTKEIEELKRQRNIHQKALNEK